MEVERALPILGRTCHAVYVAYKSNPKPDLLAVGIASLFPKPVRVFSVESDLLTPEDGLRLVEALTHSSAVVIFGTSDSKLIQRLGHSWPDYFEYSSHWSGSIVKYVNLSPARDQAELASVYLLIPALTVDHRSDRPGVFHLSAEDSSRLASRAGCVKIDTESLGLNAAEVPAKMTMRDLCLLHERDSFGPKPPRRSMDEILSDRIELSWQDLQTILRVQPEHWVLEFVRQRLTPDKYAYGRSAIEFIRDQKAETSGDVFPDIHSAVWFMERAFQHGTVFRGQFLAGWGLECTLLRAPKSGRALDVAELMQRINLTADFISLARQREKQLFEGEIDEESLLAVAQHFGFPTPLLDFTESFRIAAFFATLGAARLREDDAAIGVIFFHTSPPDKGLVSDRQDKISLVDLAGIRVGTLHLIRPNLPHVDDRIQRQHGVFLAGYRARDLQAVSIDRIYFRQHPGVTFEDPASGVSRDQLLPDNTALATFAEEVRRHARNKFPGVSHLLGATPISDSNVVGSAGAHLFWHLHFGQRYLTDLKQQADQIGANSLANAIQTTVNQYFSFAHVEAGSSEIPDGQRAGTRLVPIQNAIAALESAAGLSTDEIWKMLKDQLPKGFESGGHIHAEVPENWTASAHLAFSCAMFCIAWEHLRTAPGLRAQELVQSAMMYLARTKPLG